MNLTRTRTGIIQLTRYREYVSYVVFITILAFIVSKTTLQTQTLIHLLIVCTANILSTAFAFMINDIEDASDDAKNPDKINRNPISSKKLSRSFALFITFLTVLVSLLFYAYLGIIPFAFGLVLFLLSWMYSYRHIRLKSLPLIDMISHALMLGGLHFVLSYVVFRSDNTFSAAWFLPFLFINFVSYRGELFNELRDFEYDKKAGLFHTAVLLGKKNTQLLMTFFTAAAIILLGYSVIIGIVPISIIIVICIALLVQAVVQYRHMNHSQLLSSPRFQTAISDTAMFSTLLWLSMTIVLT